MGKVVLRVSLRLVRVDRDELHALRGVFVLRGNGAVLPGPHVWTVIAPERDDEDLLVPERREGVRLSVDPREREVRRAFADGEPLILRQFHRLTGVN